MLSKPTRTLKRRCPSCSHIIREEGNHFCTYHYGVTIFTVYDDTPEQKENSLRYVRRELEEAGICVNEEDMCVSVCHHEEDCLFINIRLTNYEGKTFLGWTPEAEEIHSRKVVLKRSNRIEAKSR